MEKPIFDGNKNISSQNNSPSGSTVPLIPTAASTPTSVKVQPKPTFLKLLHLVGAKGTTFLVSEIISYLKEYISSKQLFDQRQPWLVHCENDYLGEVFHCKQFTINDVRRLLDQNVTVCKSENTEEDNEEDESFDSDATEVLVSSMSDSDPEQETPKKTKTTTPLDDIISSSTSESISSKPITSSTDPLLRVNSVFLEILHDAGAKGEVFREKEIFRHLKNYVWSRRLFDPSHPEVILCGNDKLANVFRCDKFSIYNVPHLVAKFGVEYRPKVIRSNTEPHPKTTTPSVAVPLRSHVSTPSTGGCHTLSTPSDITSSTTDVMIPFTLPDRLTPIKSEGDNLPPTKIKSEPSSESSRTEGDSWSTVTIKSEEEQRVLPAIHSSSQEESGFGVIPPNLSIKTEPAEEPNFSFESGIPSSSVHRSRTRTQSFTLTLEMEDENEVLSFQSEEPLDDVYVEYDVVSNSSSFHMSDSEVEHHEVSMDMLVICQDSDIECYADYSDTGSDTDVELSEADKWCCSNCHLYNSPIHRLCDRCWTLRPDWLPERLPDLPDNKQTPPKAPDDSCSHVEKHITPKSSKPIKNPAATKSSLNTLRSKGNGANSSGELSSDDDDDDDEDDVDGVDADSFHSRYSKLPISSADNYDTCLNSQDLEKTTVDISCNDALDSRTTLSNICHFTEESEVPARRTTRNQTKRNNLKRSLVSESADDFSDFSSKFPKMSSSSSTSSSPVKSLVAAPAGLCIICSTNPRDACLIHGSSGHQICCLTCAKKLKQKGSKCPVCRRTIQKVVRNYLT